MISTSGRWFCTRPSTIRLSAVGSLNRFNVSRGVVFHTNSPIFNHTTTWMQTIFLGLYIALSIIEEMSSTAGGGGQVRQGPGLGRGRGTLCTMYKYKVQCTYRVISIRVGRKERRMRQPGPSKEATTSSQIWSSKTTLKNIYSRVQSTVYSFITCRSFRRTYPSTGPVRFLHVGCTCRMWEDSN